MLNNVAIVPIVLYVINGLLCLAIAWQFVTTWNNPTRVYPMRWLAVIFLVASANCHVAWIVKLVWPSVVGVANCLVSGAFSLCCVGFLVSMSRVNLRAAWRDEAIGKQVLQAAMKEGFCDEAIRQGLCKMAVKPVAYSGVSETDSHAILDTLRHHVEEAQKIVCSAKR